MGKHNKDRIAHARAMLAYQERQERKLKQEREKPPVEGESFYYRKTRETREWYVRDFIRRVELATIWPLSPNAMRTCALLHKEGWDIPSYKAWLAQGNTPPTLPELETYTEDMEEGEAQRDITGFDIE